MLKTIFSVVTFAVSGLLTLPAEAAFSRCTTASHYGVGDGYHGGTTASGERFNAYGKTAAHRTLPLGTKIMVYSPITGKSVVVRVNDRGPYHSGRDLDLSYGAFSAIAHTGLGLTKVCYSQLA